MSTNRKTSSCIVILVLVLALCGCSALRNQRPHATINDLTVSAELDSGYRLIAVDGKPVEREEGIVNTVVPFAIVAPGNHTLTLEPQSASNNPKTKISVNVDAGKRYRFAVEKGNVVVVEDVDQSPSSRK